QPFQIDRRAVSPLLGRHRVLDLNLARRKQPRLGWLLVIAGKVEQLGEVFHAGDTVDCGLHDFDARRRLVIVDANATVRIDGGDPGHQLARCINKATARAFRGSPSKVSAGSRSCSPSNTRHAATRVDPGCEQSAAIVRRIAKGSTSDTTTPARAFA